MSLELFALLGEQSLNWRHSVTSSFRATNHHKSPHFPRSRNTTGPFTSSDVAVQCDSGLMRAFTLRPAWSQPPLRTLLSETRERTPVLTCGRLRLSDTIDASHRGGRGCELFSKRKKRYSWQLMRVRRPEFFGNIRIELLEESLRNLVGQDNRIARRSCALRPRNFLQLLEEAARHQNLGKTGRA